jgi:deoxyribodipyrimidine photo-lyase
MDITFVIQKSSPDTGATELAKSASLIVVDRGYTKIERGWRKNVAENVTCPVAQVESNVVVPVETASQKEEYSAATLRPKIQRILKDYLNPMDTEVPKKTRINAELESLDFENIKKVVSELEIDHSVKKSKKFVGGSAEAKKQLELFIKNKLEKYSELKNDPTKDCISNLSPYLHFGQISPSHIDLKLMETDNPNIDAYIEELIVRRELAVNFVLYNTNYDSFDCLPEWAKKTLNEHKKDKREYSYTTKELESAQTHDKYWNAAQKEMTITGKMHGYMRMYWGKKIIEWSKTPQQAYQTALYLNNKYELDGRDPNGFAGVAWCFGKHDRPWKERQIFGKIRYMNANGLKRKFDADKYVEQVNRL